MVVTTALNPSACIPELIRLYVPSVRTLRARAYSTGSVPARSWHDFALLIKEHP